MPFDIIDLLQSSGPISLNELNMRASQSPEELVRSLERLRKEHLIVISGPNSDRSLTELSEEQIRESSDLVVQLSSWGLHRSFAR